MLSLAVAPLVEGQELVFLSCLQLRMMNIKNEGNNNSLKLQKRVFDQSFKENILIYSVHTCDK